MLVFLIRLVFAAIMATKGTSAAANENRPDVLALCQVYTAARALRKTVYSSITVDSDLADILNYNMSVATEEWRNLFGKSGDQKGWNAYKKSQGAKPGDINWEKEWDSWERQKEATKDSEQGWSKGRNIPKDEMTKEWLRSYANYTALEALKTKQQAETQPQADQKDALTALKAKIDAAICGSPLTPDAAYGECQPIAGNVEKTNTCTTKNAGSSVTLDILCLCGTQTADECTGSNPGSATTSSNNFAANTNTIFIEQCGEHLPTGTALEALKETMAAVQAKLRHTPAATAAKKIMLGATPQTSACAATNAACIDYSAKFTNKQSSQLAIPWADNLYSAIEIAQLIATSSRMRIEAVHKIKAYAIDLKREFKRKLPIQNTLSQAAETGDEKANRNGNEETETSARQCNKTNKDTEGKPPCKWDKEEKDEKKKGAHWVRRANKQQQKKQ
uniref:Variant surface glycoprotein 1125.4844 n=1 Tax=Trypanosoma brucei TaxID=5691 RepID=A0A1J0RB74_9TRYP|nr:variant surface glycoprotein 1125.4844 [Trypanosoma brucei]